MIRKAVIPAAGLGTRFLPATKVLPKELLPVVDRPVMEYAVTEAGAAGVTEIIVVVSPDKDMLLRHFAPNPELEEELESRGKQRQLQSLRAIGAGITLRSVLQESPLGHGCRCLRAGAAG